MGGYNATVLYGVVQGTPRYQYQCYGRRYCSMLLRVPRRSGAEDLLPVHFTEEQYLPFLSDGEQVMVEGALRSCNRQEEGRMRLVVYVSAQHLRPCDELGGNRVELTGALCREPSLRTTPFGRLICDILLKTVRRYGRCDYLPVIAWGASAQYVAEQTVGAGLHIVGRFQSRDYEKQLPDGSTVTRTAYEVSASEATAV